MAEPELITVGRILSVHGVKGWIKVYSLTDPIENILEYRPWYLKGDSGWQSVELSEGRRQGKGLIARLDDCSDRNEAAQRYVGREIAVPKAALPELEQDEYYWRELMGLRVRLADGRDLGRVQRLMETGANDVLVVRGDEHSLDQRERLIPWLPEQVIQEVDRQAGTVTVDWDPEF